MLAGDSILCPPEEQMAAKKRVVVPEAMPHDTFEDASLKLVEWTVHHKTTILAVFVALVLCVGGYNVMAVSRANARQERSLEFTSLVKSYDNAFGETDLEKRAKQLQDVRRALDAFVASNPGPLGDWAAMLVGHTHYHEGVTPANFNAAIKAYAAYIDRASSPESRALGYHLKGYAEESLAFLSPELSSSAKDAAASFTEAEKLAPGSWIDYESKLARARLLSAMPGKQVEARKLLETIIEERGEQTPEVQPLRESSRDLDPTEQELLDQAATVLTTYGIVARAKLALERLGPDYEGAAAAAAAKQ